MPDLTLGQVGKDHALYDYLTTNGAQKNRLKQLQISPARIDVLGLDYYSHCELEWASRTKRVYPNQSPEGLVPTALEYAERYRLPVMLSETNIRGYVTDRISWLKFMVEQCEQIEQHLAQMNLPFEGFCWYPLIDSTDWYSLVKEAKGKVDPQGIYLLGTDRTQRYASELSETFKSLARGEITSRDIPAYRFRPPLDKQLKGFLPMMAHWQWLDAGSSKPNSKCETGFQFPFVSDDFYLELTAAGAI